MRKGGHRLGGIRVPFLSNEIRIVMGEGARLKRPFNKKCSRPTLNLPQTPSL